MKHKMTMRKKFLSSIWQHANLWQQLLLPKLNFRAQQRYVSPSMSRELLWKTSLCTQRPIWVRVFLCSITSNVFVASLCQNAHINHPVLLSNWCNIATGKKRLVRWLLGTPAIQKRISRDENLSPGFQKLLPSLLIFLCWKVTVIDVFSHPKYAAVIAPYG